MLNSRYIHLHQALGLGAMWLNQHAQIRPTQGSLKAEGFNGVKTTLAHPSATQTPSHNTPQPTQPRQPNPSPATQGNALAKIRQRTPSHPPATPKPQPIHTPANPTPPTQPLALNARFGRRLYHHTHPQPPPRHPKTPTHSHPTNHPAAQPHHPPRQTPDIKRLPIRGRHRRRQTIQRRRRRNAAQNAPRHRTPPRASPFQHMAQKQPRLQPPPRRANHHRRRPQHRPRMAANPSPSHAPARRLLPPPRSPNCAQRHRPRRRALPHPPPHAPCQQSPAQTQRMGNPAKTPSRAKMI